MKKFIGLVLFLFLLSPLFGTIYYVDATLGNDAWTGEHATQQNGDGPWQSWNFVRAQTFNAGDTIKFKRGETWLLGSNDYWNLQDDGTAEDYITIEDYGSGEKPIFDCRQEFVAKVWDDEGGDVWSTALTVTTYRVQLDGVDSGKAPNAGAIDGITYLWFYDGGLDLLYVYADEDPSDAYTNILVYHANCMIFYLNGCNYIKFNNLRFHGGQYSVSNPATSVESYIEFDDVDIWYGYYGIRSEKTSGGGGSANYFTLTNCDIDAKLNLISKAISSTEQCAYDGIQAHNECDNWVIKNSTFGAWGHNMIALLNPAGHPGATQGVNNCLVEYNTFDGSAGSYCRALTFGGYDGKNVANIFRYNVVHDCNVRIQFGGNDNEFYYNLIYDIVDTPTTNKSDISQGILITAITEGMVQDGAKVYNNVFYNTYNEHIHIGNDAVNCLIKNNACFEVDGGGNASDACLWWSSDAGVGHTVSNNVFYTSTGNDVMLIGTHGAPTGYMTVLEAEAGHGGMFSDNIQLDPLMIDPASADFRLLMASPCINAGTDVGLTRDYRGRSIRHAPDIGAYEDPTNAIFMAKLFKCLKERK